MDASAMTGAVLALNVSVALLALAVGGHALEWLLRDLPDAASRVSSFTLAAQVHAAAAVGLLAVGLSFGPAGLAGAGLATAGLGLVLFCGALYLHGLAGAVWAMPATLPGALLLVIGWGLIAAALARTDGTAMSGLP
ncbi:MAG: DUF423 domain-containing protein [Pseudomonadota bacterium]